MRRIPWLLVGLVALAGCLLRTADPPRFFRPGSVTLDAPEDEVAPPAPGAIAIRLRGVRSEPFLRERIVWRVSELEYGLYGQRRWIDLPEHYVERALRTRLRATSGPRLTDDLRAPTPHVRVLAFDDRLTPAHPANLALAATPEDLDPTQREGPAGELRAAALARRGATWSAPAARGGRRARRRGHDPSGRGPLRSAPGRRPATAARAAPGPPCVGAGGAWKCRRER